MSAADSVNGASVRPLTRLPPAEAPEADALRAIHGAGGHFLLCTGDKRPLVKEWQNHPADLPAVLAHARGAGLIGVVPGSLGAVVVDLGPGGRRRHDTAARRCRCAARHPPQGDSLLVSGARWRSAQPEVGAHCRRAARRRRSRFARIS